MALSRQELLVAAFCSCIGLCLAPFLGVALIPLLVGLPLAIPAALLASGGWVGWQFWNFIAAQLFPPQQVKLCHEAFLAIYPKHTRVYLLPKAEISILMA